MSFGFSVGDFVTVGGLCWKLYRKCKDSKNEFREATNELIGLHAALLQLQDDVQTPGSLLRRSGEAAINHLAGIAKGCMGPLKELEDLVAKYDRLGSKSKRTFERLKFSKENVDGIRQKLMFHTNTLDLFLSSLGNSGIARIEKRLDELFDEIRAGKRDGSVIMSIHKDPTILSTVAGEEDGHEWNELMSELEDEDGITQQDLIKHEQHIKDYIDKKLSDQRSKESQSYMDRISSWCVEGSEGTIFAGSREDTFLVCPEGGCDEHVLVDELVHHLKLNHSDRILKKKSVMDNLRNENTLSREISGDPPTNVDQIQTNSADIASRPPAPRKYQAYVEEVEDEDNMPRKKNYSTTSILEESSDFEENGDSGETTPRPSPPPPPPQRNTKEDFREPHNPYQERQRSFSDPNTSTRRAGSRADYNPGSLKSSPVYSVHEGVPLQQKSARKTPPTVPMSQDKRFIFRPPPPPPPEAIQYFPPSAGLSSSFVRPGDEGLEHANVPMYTESSGANPLVPRPLHTGRSYVSTAGGAAQQDQGRMHVKLLSRDESYRLMQAEVAKELRKRNSRNSIPESPGLEQQQQQRQQEIEKQQYNSGWQAAPTRRKRSPPIIMRTSPPPSPPYEEEHPKQHYKYTSPWPPSAPPPPPVLREATRVHPFAPAPELPPFFYEAAADHNAAPEPPAYVGFGYAPPAPPPPPPPKLPQPPPEYGTYYSPVREGYLESKWKEDKLLATVRAHIRSSLERCDLSEADNSDSDDLEFLDLPEGLGPEIYNIPHVRLHDQLPNPESRATRHIPLTSVRRGPCVWCARERRLEFEARAKKGLPPLTYREDVPLSSWCCAGCDGISLCMNESRNCFAAFHKAP